MNALSNRVANGRREQPPDALPLSANDVPLHVIIPVTNRTTTLTQCLLGLERSIPAFGADVSVVYDDADPVGISRKTERFHVREIRSPVARSAAAARNHGAASSTRGIIVFLDADVILDPEAIERLLKPIFDGEADATVGNYSTAVVGMSFLQKYKQLYIATIYSRRKGYLRNEYWTAIGAVKANIFHDLGGFSVQFTGACGEDTELGQRMTARGFRIAAVPNATGRHLKEFTLLGLLRNDFRKGIQMALGALRNGNRLQDVRHSSSGDMIAVFCCWALFPLALLALWVPLHYIGAALPVLVLVWIVARRDLLRSLASYRVWFAVASIPLAALLDLVRGLCVIIVVCRYVLIPITKTDQ